MTKWTYTANTVSYGELEMGCGHKHDSPDEADECAIRTFHESYRDSHVIIAEKKKGDEE